MKKRRVLISENRNFAEKHIETLKAQISGMVELIRVFNTLPVITPIETVEQVEIFLDDPVAFLDDTIVADSGMTFKHKPVPEQVAAIFGIPYEQFIKQISRVHVSKFDEKLRFEDGELSLNPEYEKSIFEQFKEYAGTEAEAEEIIKDRKLCKLLNERVARYEIPDLLINQAAQNLYLKSEVKPDGHGYEFREDIGVIREKLEHERMHPE